jgi:ABC-type lipoprotein export system ATPase subunit
MSFNLDIPKISGVFLPISIEAGDKLFIMGANGTGKSSLMQWVYKKYYAADTRWISAHRQTWFTSNAIDFSPQQRRNYENSMRSEDLNLDARWKDQFANHRASIALYDLIDADNVRNRAIAGAVDSHEIEEAKNLSKKNSVIKIINELLSLSNIPIELFIHESDQLFARKGEGTPYSVAELSDGERNALLIAANVLTVKSGSLLLIDEPERHLHRSIISPFLTYLFSKRKDCAFIVSTHDMMLPLDNPSARTLLIRSCTHEGSSVTGWDIDIVPPGTKIDDDIKKDILGARRKIIFVEGVENSLDKALYSLVFPNASIIAKSNCPDVERSVYGIRHCEDDLLHWVRAFGIVDNDKRPEAHLTRLRNNYIYALSVYSIESIYYHPDIQRLIAERQAKSIGGDASAYLSSAKTAAMKQIEKDIPFLSKIIAEKAIRKKFYEDTHKRINMDDLNPIEIHINVSEFVEQESELLKNALDNDNYIELILKYPLHKTKVVDKIAEELKFTNHKYYERDVQKLLRDSPEALNSVKSLLGSLVFKINEG